MDRNVDSKRDAGHREEPLVNPPDTEKPGDTFLTILSSRQFDGLCQRFVPLDQPFDVFINGDPLNSR